MNSLKKLLINMSSNVNDPNKIFYFPQTSQNYKTLFNGYSNTVQTEKIQIHGFKLVCFVDLLDYEDSPYLVAPIKSNHNVHTYFYAINFPIEVPDFKEFGLKLESFSDGYIIHMDPCDFADKVQHTRYVTIKSGDWASVESDYISLAAYYHLDLMPSLSLSYFKDLSLLERISKSFQENYSTGPSYKITLKELFSEIYYMLYFFGYLSNDNHIETSGACFGNIAKFFRKFCVDCFTGLILSAPYLTPYAVQQLRCLYKFVANSLSCLGHKPSSHISYEILKSSLTSYQKEMNLPIGPCDKETMNSILSSLTRYQIVHKQKMSFTEFLKELDVEFGNSVKKTQRSNTLDLSSIEKEFDNTHAKRFIRRFNNCIHTNYKLSYYTESIQDKMEDIIASGIKINKPIYDSIFTIDKRLRNIYSDSEETNNKLKGNFRQIKHIEDILSSISNDNSGLETHMQRVREDLIQENRRCNNLLLILVLFFLIFLRYKNA